MSHKNDSVAHLIGSSGIANKAPVPDSIKSIMTLNVNGHHVEYQKEGSVMTNADAQSVTQHIRSVEMQAHRKAGLDTDDLERPRKARGLGVRTASEDFDHSAED